MMDNPVRRLRIDARQFARGKVPTAVRYPAAFRAAALALARPRLARGGSIARVARDLGLPMQSLGRWLRLPTATATALRRVALTHFRQFADGTVGIADTYGTADGLYHYAGTSTAAESEGGGEAVGVGSSGVTSAGGRTPAAAKAW